MWRAEIEALQGGRVHQYSLWDGPTPLSRRQVAEGWRDPGFAEDWGGLLGESSFDAYFWELPPLVQRGWDDPFTFVLVDSPALARVEADPGPFAEQLRPDREVVCFDNLSGGTRLIAPCDVTRPYAHLAAFVRSAPASTNRALWAAAADALVARVGERPLWLSTSGLGVYWLHLRLDPRPKYYTFAPYRRAPG